MIVVKIFQGPGNQMFQVAFGLAAAKRLNVELKVDLSWYKEYSNHRQYILDRFDVNPPVATDKEIYDIITCNGANYISYKWNQLNRLYLRPYYQRPKITESIDKFDLNYTRITDNTYIEGYFSSRDFFADYQDAVKKALQFVSPPSDLNSRMIDQIKSENAVAISFRLGDFLKHPWHNVCSLKYYERSIRYLTERYSNLRFYVFSDDINWVKQHLKSDQQMIFMEHNQADYMEDFRLLTNFKFHIIPNSTFSWWGAFLAPESGKVVVCPEYWLSPDKEIYASNFEGKMVDFTRVLPDEWAKVPNILKGDRRIGL